MSKSVMPATGDVAPLLREILRVLKSSNPDQLAYSVPELAARMNVSDEQIYKHIANGDLSVKFSGTKKLILVDEARRFVNELPDEARALL